MLASFKQVTVIGLGYIGLPTASLLATKGYTVAGCDVTSHVVETINKGQIHIVEQDLDVLVKSAVQSGHLKAYHSPQPADVFIIAVPTPFKNGHVPDISYVESAVNSMAPVLKPGNLIILESTSPVGTTQRIANWLKDLRSDLKIPDESVETSDSQSIFIAHCPERVLPGQIIRELVDNDRIIGGIDKASTECAKHFYETFVSGQLLLTNAKTAEMAKLSENAFRDVNIAFANELDNICNKLDINTWELIRLANHHPRVNILQPGPGVGGHCIAVDPWFIVDSAPKEARLIRTAREVNDERPNRVIEKVKVAASSFKEPVISCLGLSFKANIDDLRESPALNIVQQLAELKLGRMLIVEPHIENLPAKLAVFRPDVHLSELTEALQAADIILLLVDHHVFANVDKKLLINKVVIDTRGLWQLC